MLELQKQRIRLVFSEGSGPFLMVCSAVTAADERCSLVFSEHGGKINAAVYRESVLEWVFRALRKCNRSIGEPCVQP